MRIGVDATCWHNTRGYGRHARTLLGHLIPLDPANQYTLFLDAPVRLNSLPARADVRMVPSSRPTALAASADGHRSASDMWRMSRPLPSRDLDLVVFPAIY